MSFTTSDYDPAVDKGIFTSTPKPKQELYTDFFPLELEVLPSPVHSPSPVNLSPSPPTHLPPPSSKLLPVQLSPTSPLQSNRLFSERRKLNRARISNRYMWIPELGLRKFDKEVLQSETGWLNDNIVDAAQILLKKVCPIQGLQKVSLGLTLIFEVQHGEFIQILNTGAGHWVTISTIGTDHPVVNIYDSVYSTACDELQQQIASILITPHSSIILHFIDVSFNLDHLIVASLL